MIEDDKCCTPVSSDWSPNWEAECKRLEFELRKCHTKMDRLEITANVLSEQIGVIVKSRQETLDNFMFENMRNDQLYKIFENIRDWCDYHPYLTKKALIAKIRGELDKI